MCWHMQPVKRMIQTSIDNTRSRAFQCAYTCLVFHYYFLNVKMKLRFRQFLKEKFLLKFESLLFD